MTEFTILLTLAFATSILLGAYFTLILKRLLRRWDVIDEENERSLHSGRVPRGGGIAILLVVGTVQIFFSSLGQALSGQLLAFWILTLLAGALGVADDFRDLSIVLRLLFQVCLGIGFFYFSGYSDGERWWLAGPIAVATTVVVVNTTNFMDGADGLLTTQALAIILGAGVWQALQLQYIESLYSITLAGGLFGFLFWNWSPAKIFLGDAGSYFIGATFVMYIFNIGELALIPLLIVMMPLMTDAILTLLSRIFGGEKFWQAHRNHVYQMAVLSGIGHARVSSALLLILVVIYLPLCACALSSPQFAESLLCLSAVISLSIWLFLRGFLQNRIKNLVK